MPKEILWSAAIGLYLGLSILVFAGMNAQSQWDCHHRWTNICDEEMVARDRGFDAFVAMALPGWIAGFFATAGFHHGFSLSAEPHITSGKIGD